MTTNNPTIPPSIDPENGPKRVGRPPSRFTREALREEPSVRETAVRAPEGERLQRRRTRTENPFDIQPNMVPEGMTYEWKRKYIFNKPDVQHMVAMQDNHWQPVPASRHPYMMPADQQSGCIERDGLVLMERPAYLTAEARQEDYDEARLAVQIKEQQLSNTPSGHLTRKHGSAGAKISHDYAPLVVPKE